MAIYYATCHTPDNNDSDRRIQGLGGSFGWFTIDAIIHMIDVGHVFYTHPPIGISKKIITRTHANGRRYLTTEGDGFPPNNILNLPICR